MKTIKNLDLTIGRGRRLIVRVYLMGKSHLFPDGIKFAIQYLFLKDSEWIEIARVDNYKHDNVKVGSHIHKLGLPDAEFRDISPEEAEEYIMQLSESIIDWLMLEGD